MGFFRLQSKLVYPPSFPPRLSEKSRRELKSLYPYRGNNEFSILAEGTFTFKAVSPQKNTTLRGDDFADIAPL